MWEADGFVLGKCLASDGHQRTYEATRRHDGREVVLKLASDSLDAETEAELSREFEALSAVAGPGIVQALELLTEEVTVLVLDRVPGRRLAGWLSAGPLELRAFLEIAIQLAEALGRVHAARWIHGYVTPNSAIVVPASLEAVLIGFHLAQPLGAESRSAQKLAARGDLRYMAPEQTGRMNRGVDARSDLYALGATLYHALSGEPPFPISDPLALIHAHMARVPPPPTERNPRVPIALARIVLKLLEKQPESRYQSAAALVADLRLCRDALLQRGHIDDTLALGATHAPDRPQFSSKLYDRERETELIRALYRQVRDGSPKVLVIAGQPGAGKSALIEVLRPDVAESSGYVAIGKFDLSRDRPYAAWIAAIDGLVRQFLAESDARLSMWREALCAALGSIAKVLVELVPDLQFVVGEVPDVPRLGPRETQARLALALRRFLKACAAAEHPLVLFLDDLQWADGGSRDLLEDLLAQGDALHLLVMGAHRADEIGPDHALSQMLERLPRIGISIERITLRPLTPAATVAMLSDVLERRSEDVGLLAELIERKTGNAPLFVRQFVELLHARSLLHYELGLGWTWDASAVAASDIPDGAVALMTAKLEGLAPDARAAIELASCIADQFTLDELCLASSLERGPLEQGLYTLCHVGLIAPCPEGFRFAHDRIREAARLLLSEDAQARLHAEIAQRLLAGIPEQDQRVWIFEIAEHLDCGLAHWPAEQRVHAIRLNVMAAQHSLALGAAATAERFLAVGRGLLRDEDWGTEHALAFELLIRSAEAAFIRRDFPATLALTEALDRQRLSVLQRAQVAARRIQVLALSQSPEQCVRHLLGVLRQFGVSLPMEPSRLRTSLTLRRVAWQLRGSRVQRALRPNPAPDAGRIAPILLMGSAAGALQRFNCRVAGLAAAWIAASNARHGYIGGPSFGLGSFAMSLQQQVAGAAREAARLADAALDWESRSGDAVWATKNGISIHGIVRPWVMPRRRAVAPLDRVANLLFEVGDPEFGYYARFLKTFISALAGQNVGKTTLRFEELCESIRRAGLRYREPELCLRPYRMLSARECNERSLRAELADSDAELARYQGSAEPYVRTLWMMVLCVHGGWALALEQSEALGDRLFRTVPFVHVADHMFYRGLAAAALATTAASAQRRLHRKTLRSSLRRLKRWARDGPDFAHMALLLDAERMRLAGVERPARALYERAAQGAEHQEFTQHAALAHERLGRMHVDLGRHAQAALELGKASALYQTWGAQGKTDPAS